MSDGFQFFDIIFIAMLAGFIILRLRSVLGRRTGNERPPSEEVQRRYEAPAEKPVAATVGGQNGRGDAPAIGGAGVEAPEYRLGLDENSPAFDGIEAIRRRDRSFDLDSFVAGARGAYDLILTGFWSGDREAFRPFVSNEVFEQFDAVIRERESAGLTLDNKLERVRRIDVVGARLNGTVAEITLRFTVDAVFVTLDSEGRVVEGTPVDEVEVQDVWTFERDLNSRDPNWTLISTASEDA